MGEHREYVTVTQAARDFVRILGEQIAAGRVAAHDEDEGDDDASG